MFLIKKIKFIALRFAATTITPTIFLGSLAVYHVYDSYWNTTIYRTQTVDFNLLSHTLPTKLSYALYYQDFDEVQRTLDSNFGLFGLVITNSSGGEIKFITGGLTSEENQPKWKQNLLSEPSSLKLHPYDYLTSPPPLITQSFYETPRAHEPIRLIEIDKDSIIGRIYYIRGITPSFTDDLLLWISNPFSDSSRVSQYSLVFSFVFLGFILVWLTSEFIIYRLEVSKQKISDNLEDARKQAVYLDNERNKLQQDIFRAVREQELLKELANQGKVVAEELQISQQEIFSLRSQLSEISSLYKVASKEIEQLENKGIVVDWTSKEENEFGVEVFSRGELQIKIWLESFDFKIHPKFKKKQFQPEFKRISKFIGNNYELISSAYLTLKSRLGNKNTKNGFKFRFKDRVNSPERQAILNFFQQLHLSSFLEKRYIVKENAIEVRKISTNGEKSGFLSGGWLEIYLLQKVLSFFGRLNDEKIRFCFLNNLVINLPNEEEAELDLILMIEYGSKLKIPVVFECKTGEFRLALDKYSRIGRLLNLSAEQVIFVIVDHIDITNKEELEQGHNVRIVNLNEIDELLDGLLNKISK